MKIFFSHSSRDKPLLREIRRHLPSHITIWMDEKEIRIGEHIEGALQTAIRQEADFMVLFIGPEAVKSSWVKKN